MEALEKRNERFYFYRTTQIYYLIDGVRLAVKVLPTSQTHENRVLGNFSEFLMTLMKLRLNLKINDLAYYFGVCESVVTHTIHKWQRVLYKTLNFLIR